MGGVWNVEVRMRGRVCGRFRRLAVLWSLGAWEGEGLMEEEREGEKRSWMPIAAIALVGVRGTTRLTVLSSAGE